MKAEEFKKIRKSAGMNQWQVAKYLECTQTYVSLWERGYKPIPVDIIKKMNQIHSELSKVV